LSSCAPGTPPVDLAPPAQGIVKTIAGSGAPGIKDGPAAAATFLMPTALARAADGTLYITDEAAQRIRTLSPDGTVHTVAGSGPLGRDGLSVKGGYADGPALKAQFSRPTGLLLGKRGELYIADSRNGCIRKLENGTVSTFAGTCGQSAAKDGPRAAARLLDPRALGFAGNDMYVADYGAGLRRIDPSGAISTIVLKEFDDKDTWGLAVGGAQSDPTVTVSAPDRLLIYHPLTRTFEWTGLFAEGNRPFGSPNQLAAIDRREYIFSDLRSSNLRYMRLKALPFVTSTFTHAVAGGTTERTVENVGFKDGPVFDARFYAPRGLTLAGDTVYVADSGNRRIRSFGLPNLRMSETGFSDTAPYDTDHYEIVYIGASWTFWDSMGDDSICGRLEAALDGAHRFSKPVRCHHVRLDSASLQEMETYIANYLTGHVDLVVLDANLPEAFSLFKNNAPPTLEAAASALRANVALMKTRLEKNGTKLFLIWNFAGDDVSDAENLYERDEDGHRLFPVDLSDNYEQAAGALIKAVNAIPIPQYDTYNDFLRYEQGPAVPPLFGTDDSHMTNYGSALFAALLARAIEQNHTI
jgi:hypothetical protein